MFRNALITLDGSSYSEAALPSAVALLQGTDCLVHMLTVRGEPKATPASPVKEPLMVSVPAPGGVVRVAAARTAESIAQATDRIVEEGRRFLAGKAAPLDEAAIRYETAVRFGDAADEIVRYARENDIEVIVMATHGHTGLARLVFGSVASRVLASGVCPVLLIRPDGLKKE
jgi:nucleotide-binding universal stress UspA family protein